MNFGSVGWIGILFVPMMLATWIGVPALIAVLVWRLVRGNPERDRLLAALTQLEERVHQLEIERER